jgi:hypothetical protein
MEHIGILKIQKQGKQVTNGAYWSPENPETGKTGHQ